MFPCEGLLSVLQENSMKTKTLFISETTLKEMREDFYFNTVEIVQQLASLYEWEQIDIQENICMISFKKNDVRFNFYYSKYTVGTAMNHPVKGKTQLFRKNVTFDILVQLFKNPRKHTGKGYYTK